MATLDDTAAPVPEKDPFSDVPGSVSRVEDDKEVVTSSISVFREHS